jgi:SlyX protein
MEERITELESRVAFQDRTIRDLDEVVRLFSKRVERLERRLSDLAGELRADGGEVGPHDEKPPHY